MRLSSVTPQLIIIEPPERLVIEVQSSGAYDLINWARNGAFFIFNDPISSDRFFYFYEAYVREPTSMDDLGLYEVSVTPFSDQDTQLAPDQFFTVVRYGEFCASVFASDSATCTSHFKPVLTCGPLYLLIHVHLYGYEIALSVEIKGKDLRSLLVGIVMVWIANAQTLYPKAVHFCLQITNTLICISNNSFTCNISTLRDRQLSTLLSLNEV